MQRTAGVFGRRVTTQTSATIFGGKAFGQLRSQRWVSLEAKVKSLNAGEQRFKLYHATSIGLAVLLPVGLMTSPSVLSFPIDTVLAVLIPAHAHLGTRNIILDYVPRQFQFPSMWGLRIAGVLAFLGLLKINQTTGISDGIKHLWRAPKPKSEAAKH